MWNERPKRILVAASLALALGGGIAHAQTDPTPTKSETVSPAEPGAHAHGEGSGEMLNVAAQAIGITPQQLEQELPGHSLAQVAEAHGKSPADVATALKTAAHARIDQHIDTEIYRVVPLNAATATPPSPTAGT